MSPPVALAGGPSPMREIAGLAERRVGLWVFMGVVGMLFFLFSCAYVMRMAVSDWRALPVVPWQLWCGTALLAASAMAWQLGWRAAATGRREAALRACTLAGGASILFLAVQLWAWRAMGDLNFPVEGNPANSFFYLITGLHGLHVVGGLLAAAMVGWRLARGGPLEGLRAAIELCARYWHFLLGLWLAMFALLFLVTPATVQLICNSF